MTKIRYHRSILTGLLLLTTLLLGSSWAGASGTPQDTPIWGTDVRANTDDSGRSQHEPHLAISRTNPDVVVVVAKDYRRIDTKEVWIYVSQDGGQTWPLDKQLRVPGLPGDIAEQSDPVVIARDDGRIYVVCLGKGSSSHGLFITWSDDDGDNWQDAVNITYNQTPGSLDDKEWLAIDNNPASSYYHNMYVTWADPYGLGILFSRSTDEGATWSPYMDMIPGSSDFTEYTYPVVAPDGDLYVFYMDGWGYCTNGTIRYLKSVDGGVSFSGPYDVASAYQPCSPIHSPDQWRFFSIIAAAADPNDPNNLWVAWTDDYDINYGQTDVLYVRSTDGGSTWSARERLSHDPPGTGKDHITPVFAVQDLGGVTRLHAFWLDRRADPSNLFFHGYHSSTTDGGLTWSPDSQVSDEAFDLNVGFPPPSGYNAAGDYWGLDVVGDIVMAAWNTTVRGEQDIYVSRGLFTSTVVVTLTGQVWDNQSLDPIHGALIAAGPTLTTSTNLAGHYTMTLSPGTYTVTASAAGYLPWSIPNLELVSGTVEQNFALDPLPPVVTLTGRVRDSQSLAPIAGADVWACT